LLRLRQANIQVKPPAERLGGDLALRISTKARGTYFQDSEQLGAFEQPRLAHHGE
jgi:hypothetical protein